MRQYRYPAKPGEPNGPCPWEQCRHVACETFREAARQLCSICQQPIGYGNAIYFDPPRHVDCDINGTWKQYRIAVLWQAISEIAAFVEGKLDVRFDVHLSKAMLRELRVIADPEHTITPANSGWGFVANTYEAMLKRGVIRHWQPGDPTWKSYVITPGGQQALDRQYDFRSLYVQISPAQWLILERIAAGVEIYNHQNTIQSLLWKKIIERPEGTPYYHYKLTPTGEKLIEERNRKTI